MSAVLCPKCGRKVTEVGAGIKEYYDPHFSHGCGYKGTLCWRREQEIESNKDSGVRNIVRLKREKQSVGRII